MPDDDNATMPADAAAGWGILVGGMLEVMRCADAALRAAAPAVVVLAREVNRARPQIRVWLRAHEADLRAVAHLATLLLHESAPPVFYTVRRLHDAG